MIGHNSSPVCHVRTLLLASICKKVDDISWWHSCLHQHPSYILYELVYETFAVVLIFGGAV